MSDVWEWRMQYDASFHADSGDADGDGVSNFAEAQFGTDPFAPASTPPSVRLSVSGTELQYAFDSIAGIAYQLQGADSLGQPLNPWQDLGLPEEGDGGAISGTVRDIASGRYFVRLSSAKGSDHDSDSLDAYEELLLGTSNTSSDSDGDLMPDGFETATFLHWFRNGSGSYIHPTNPATNGGVRDNRGDLDGDGVSNRAEYLGGTNPSDPSTFPPSGSDFDSNGFEDNWQATYFDPAVSQISIPPAGQAAEDNADGDRLTNEQEEYLGLDPLNSQTGQYPDGLRDTDNDGVIDEWEFEDGTDPLNADDVDYTTNFTWITGRITQLSGPILDPGAYAGTTLKVVAEGYESADRSTGSFARRRNAVEKAVTAITGPSAGSSIVAEDRFLLLRKGVNYKVTFSTTNNNLPQVSGQFFWTNTTANKPPAEEYFAYKVDDVGWYAANASGFPVIANPDLAPGRPANKHFYLWSGTANPDDTGTLVLVEPKFRFWELTAEKELKLVDGPSLTTGAPDVNVSSFNITNTRPSTDGSEILADISFQATIKSDSLDLIEGAAGTISQLTWQSNPGAVQQVSGPDVSYSALSSGHVSVTVSKGNAPTSTLKPYPYSGTVDTTLTGVRISEGVNTFRLQATNTLYKSHGHVEVGFTINATPPAPQTAVETLGLTFTAPPSDTGVDTVALSRTLNGATTPSGALTETGPSTLIFESADGTIRVAFASPLQLQSSAVDTISATIDWQAMGATGQTWSAMTESASDSLMFSQTITYEDYSALENYHNYTIQLETGAPAAASLRLFSAEMASAARASAQGGSVGSPVGPGAIIAAKSQIGDVHVYYIEIAAPKDYFSGWGNANQAIAKIEAEAGPIYSFQPLPPDYKRVAGRPERFPDQERYFLVQRNSQTFATFQVVAGPAYRPAPSDGELQSLTKHLVGRGFMTSYSEGFLAGGTALINTKAGQASVLFKNATNYAGALLTNPKVTLTKTSNDVQQFFTNKMDAVQKLAPVVSHIAQRIAVDGQTAVEAYIVGDDETLKGVTEPYRDFAFMTAEILEAAHQEFASLPEHQRAYLFGRMTPELVWTFAENYVTGGAGIAIGKANFLKNFSVIHFFQSTNPRIVALNNRVKTIAQIFAGTRMCFVAGTEIHTAEGLVPIERVQPGTFVWSRNPDTGAQELKAVLDTFVTRPKSLYHVRFSSLGRNSRGSPDELVCTGEHPFFVKGKHRFVAASDLSEGDRLQLMDGTSAYITSISEQHAQDGEAFTTYNFEVQDFLLTSSEKAGCGCITTGRSTARSCSRSSTKKLMSSVATLGEQLMILLRIRLPVGQRLGRSDGNFG